ncbi:MAG: dihydroxyacetone kinase subunit DhaL [Kiritimatiellae bacterium]|nr:dihydroxyacetone kinase subunit DhaL [Kiritimatiellia bacterium]
MKTKLSFPEFILLLDKICIEMEAAGEKLGELDAACGDGDLGMNVMLGFKAVRENLPMQASADIGEVLVKSGLAFGKAGASTFGALLSTAFIRAGGRVKGLKEIDLSAVAGMIKAAVEGVRERGKAQAGERTMLDAMIPVQAAVEKSLLENKSLKEFLETAAVAAEQGAAATADMKAKHGRAGWLSERSKNIPDAGATAMAVLFRAAAKHAQLEQ